MYKTIQADPPWQYSNKNTGGNMKSGASNKYPTMSTDEICALDIPGISDKNSCLFLWGTTPLLPDALRVLNAWGYTYKTTLYWEKIMQMGLGFWWRGQVEYVLFGIKGKVASFRMQESNIIQCKVGKHSEKPEEMYNKIERAIDKMDMFPAVELFARKERIGWDCIGNELGITVEEFIKLKKHANE